jgi:hypothetical protein
MKILRYKTIDGRDFCFVANAVARITDTPDGPRVKLKWGPERLLDEVSTADVISDVQRNMVNNANHIQVKIIAMINLGFRSRSKLRAAMQSVSLAMFNFIIEMMLKSGTILAHKEGRGTAYSLKGSE